MDDMVCNNGVASGRKYNKWFRNDFLSKYHRIVIKYNNTKVLYIQYTLSITSSLI